MKTIQRYSLFFVLLFATAWLHAQGAEQQDITGLWRGTLYNDTTQKTLVFEIAISEEKGKYKGYSYTIFDIDGKKETGIKQIKIRRKQDELILEDVALISNNYSVPPPRGVRMLSKLQLEVADSLLFLKGRFSTNPTREYRALTGSVQLKRSTDFKPTAFYQKLTELKLDDELSFIKTPAPIVTKAPVAIAKNEQLVNPSTVIDTATIMARAKSKEKDLIIKEPQPVMAKAAIVKQQTSKLNEATKKQPIAPTPDTNKSTLVNKNENPAPPKQLPTPETKAAPLKKNAELATSTEKKPTVTITKKDTIQQRPIVLQPILPATVKAAEKVAERKVASVQLVFYKSDSLTLTLYDNGDVDGDTVSVLMNGSLIFAKQGLTTKANSKTIYTNQGNADSITLLMYAENLGSIPPNTGLLVVQDGELVYYVRFSADLQSNATIILRKKQDE